MRPTMSPSAEHAALPLQMVLEGVLSDDRGDRGDYSASTYLCKVGHLGAALMAN